MTSSNKYLTLAMGLLLCCAVSEARANTDDAQLYLFEAAGEGMAAKCECGEDLDAYERCLKKQVKAAVRAFKTGAKYLGLDQSGLREELTYKVEDLVLDCELGSDEPEEEDPGNDGEEF